MRQQHALWLAVPFLFAACVEQTDDAASYDEALLARYRAAIPTADKLLAPSPEANGTTRDVGQLATYPVMAKNLVVGEDGNSGINGIAVNILAVLHAIVDLPPTIYNSETREFFWGMWPNDDAHDNFGFVGAYIKELVPEAAVAAIDGACAEGLLAQGETGLCCHKDLKLDADGQTCVPDFRFVYAFVRSASEDLATFAPVIWGGVNPNEENEDHGTGVTLWDLEANYEFAQAHDPGADSKSYPRGRFVAFYGKGYSDDPNDDPSSTFTYNLAVFRNFLDRDAPAAALGADLDYLYGRYVTLDADIAFLDFGLTADMAPEGAPDGLDELLTGRMVFLNLGLGRGDLTLSGGTYDAQMAGHYGHGTECWNSALQRQYYVVVDGAAPATVWEGPEGAIENCGFFAEGIPEWVPTRDQAGVGELLAFLGAIAETGVVPE